MLCADSYNPALRTPEEIQKIIAEDARKWQMKVSELENSEAYQNADYAEQIRMLMTLREDMESE